MARELGAMKHSSVSALEKSFINCFSPRNFDYHSQYILHVHLLRSLSFSAFLSGAWSKT